MRDFEKLRRCPHCGATLDMTPVYLTIGEVKQMTGWHYNTIYRHRKDLGGVKRCGRWKFAVGSVEKFMAERTV